MSRENTCIFHAFKATLDRLQSMHAVVALRPKDVCLQDAFNGDYDLLFDPAKFSEILAIAVVQCRNHGVSMIVDQSAPYKKQLSFISNNSNGRILIELWPHAELTVSDRFVSRTAIIDWDAVSRYFIDNNGYPKIRVDVSAAIYITHLYHKQKTLDSPEVQRRLAFYKRELSRLGEEIDNKLLSLIESLSLSTIDVEEANVQAYLALLRMGVQVKISRTLPIFQRMWDRLLAIIRVSSGKFLPVPVIGPDGSGKTAIVGALVDQEGVAALRFKNVFRMSIIYQAYYFIRKKFNASPIPKNIVDEKILPLILMISLLQWWPFIITLLLYSYLCTGARGAVLVDRYFWDYLLRLRDEEVLPARIAGYDLFSKFVPTPDRAVILCCDLQTIHSRKEELTSVAIECLYRLYCDQIARKRVRRVLMLSTNGSFDLSYNQAVRFLLPNQVAKYARPSGRDQAVQPSATDAAGG